MSADAHHELAAKLPILDTFRISITTIQLINV